MEAVVHTSPLLLVATLLVTLTTDSSPILTVDTRLAVDSLSTIDRTSTEVTDNTTIATEETTISDEALLLLSTSVSLTDTEVTVVTEKVLLHETTGVQIGVIISMGIITINVLARRLDPTFGIIAAKPDRLCIQRNMPRTAILLFKIFLFFIPAFASILLQLVQLIQTQFFKLEWCPNLFGMNKIYSLFYLKYESFNSDHNEIRIAAWFTSSIFF